MDVKEIPAVIEGELMTRPADYAKICGGYTSDLLSDVMGNAAEGDVLITIQAHKNTVAVAQLVGIPAIILCNGRKGGQDMIALAEQENIAIIGTKLNQFSVSHLLGTALDKG